MVSKLVDGVAYEVDCTMITIKEGDVDIGEVPRSNDDARPLTLASQVPIHQQKSKKMV